MRRPLPVRGIVRIVTGLPLLLASVEVEARFTDVTEEAGLVHNQFLSADLYTQQWSFMTGGAAVTDYDGDGYPDVYMTRMDDPDLLYRNRGDGTFRVASPPGLGVGRGANGCAWGDVDNDGDRDLYVTTVDVGRNYFFVNNGDGSFSEAAEVRGVHAPVALQNAHCFSVTFGDYDRDGFLDIHTTSWSDRGGAGTRLFRNRGAAEPGYFDEVTATAGVELAPGGQNRVWAFTSQFADFDEDGWPELAVAADFGTSRLFWNQRNGTFLDRTQESGVGGDENGMGSAIGDINGDGRPDWFITSIFDDPARAQNWGVTGNRLYINDTGREFSDGTTAAGVRDGQWGWGTVMFDFDNDGDLDIAMTGGIVYPFSSVEDHFNEGVIRLWRNDGEGTFTEIAADVGLTGGGSGRGMLTFDYDRDGDADLLVVDNIGRPRLFRNDSPAGNSICVLLNGTESNRDGVGARLCAFIDGAVRAREHTAATGYLTQSEHGVRFGLGEATVADSVRIEWPSGIAQTLTCIGAGRTVVVREDVAVDPERVAGFDVRLDGLVVTLRWTVCTSAEVSSLDVLRRRRGADFVILAKAIRAEAGEMRFTDVLGDLQRGATLEYALDAHLTTGKIERIGGGAVEVPAPDGFYLSQNAPNPFAERTRIHFSLKEAGHARLDVYRVDGSLVRRVLDEARTPGAQFVEWDGRDSNGRRIGRGVYFYRLSYNGSVVAARKLLVIR